MTASSASAPQGGGFARSPAISPAALAEAFECERRLLEELLSIFHRQRQGVAADDVEAVNDSVFCAYRVLHTLGEARRRRRSLLAALTGSEDLELAELEDALGPAMTEQVARARDALLSTARALSQAIAINRRVLQEALRAGEEQIRSLCGVAQQQVRYDAAANTIDGARPVGLILNRRV
ncbi:MAG TPA: flagellar export chaperone FlgN [Longimicrobiales bacterium]|jgi:hypothetical protein